MRGTSGNCIRYYTWAIIIALMMSYTKWLRQVEKMTNKLSDVCVPIVVRGCGGEGCLPVQLRPQSLYRWPAPSPLLRHSSAPIPTLIISLTFAPSPLSHALKPRVQCNLPPLQCTGTQSRTSEASASLCMYLRRHVHIV